MTAALVAIRGKQRRRLKTRGGMWSVSEGSARGEIK